MPSRAGDVGGDQAGHHQVRRHLQSWFLHLVQYEDHHLEDKAEVALVGGAEGEDREENAEEGDHKRLEAERHQMLAEGCLSGRPG